MSAVVFLGPSLPAEEARALYARPDLHLLPPAEQGDVLRALSLRPRVIGLVDGRFDGVPAVLHKEILHALASGVHVLGAASMGALRAAELHGYGMQGVGAVFAAYRDGSIEDDDAVALLHAGPEHGYQALSEALVDIAATLVAARDAGVLDTPRCDHLREAATALDYGHRQWPALLAVLRESAGDELTAVFEQWLASGRVHAKRDDARALIARLRDMLEADVAPFNATFELQPSHPWEDFRARQQGGAPGVDGRAVLDEIRLDAPLWQRLRDAALLRLLARREAARQRLAPRALDTGAVLARLRADHSLARRADLVAWLQGADLDESGLHDVLLDQAAAQRVADLLGEDLQAAVLVQAGLAGDLPALRRRAVHKQTQLADEGGNRAASPDTALLLEWHFQHRQRRAVPADLDAYAATLGLRDREELLQLLTGEYLYCNAGGVVDDGPRTT